MKHTELFKRAITISWRYRALWLFGFLLALCSGGSGGRGNFNFPSGDTASFDLPSDTIPNVEPAVILVIVGLVICLVLILAVVGVVVRAVTRTALIGMVRQISETEVVAMRDGWQFGWSRRAWRLFLVGLVIGIPVAIVSIGLIALSLSPLLVLLFNDTTATVAAIVLTVVLFLFALLLVIAISAVIAPFQELAWRRTVLGETDVFASLGDGFRLIKQNFKDVLVMWLLMIGAALLWGLASLFVVLPVALIVALLIGGIPAGLVYLASSSVVGALVTGIPLAVIALILVMSAASAFYLIFHSAVWTLTYLELPNRLTPPVDVTPPAAEPSS